MSRGTGSPFDPDKLMSDFRIYDRAVDVVSAYHWLFTETDEMPSTVAHFERYPKIAHPDGHEARPDFTVLFNDGCGLVAEIANIALHDNSIEKICHQLLRYDSLNVLPGPDGTPVAVGALDVIFLTPMDNAEAAIQRIYRDRLLAENHSYKPRKPPVTIQFGFTSEKYVFQVWPDKSVNGTLTVSDRSPDYARFNESLKIRPTHFGANKVKWAFVNDPIAPLYLASRLWSNVFSSFFEPGDIQTTTAHLASLLRQHFRRGEAQEVRAAMQVLEAAGLAASGSGGSWSIQRSRNLRALGADVPEAIAKLVGSQSRRLRTTGRVATPASPATTQDYLFET